MSFLNNIIAPPPPRITGGPLKPGINRTELDGNPRAIYPAGTGSTRTTTGAPNANRLTWPYTPPGVPATPLIPGVNRTELPGGSIAAMNAMREQDAANAKRWYSNVLLQQAQGVFNQYNAGQADVLAAFDNQRRQAQNNNLLKQVMYGRQEDAARGQYFWDVAANDKDAELNWFIRDTINPMKEALLGQAENNAAGRYNTEVGWFNTQNAQAEREAGDDYAGLGVQRRMLESARKQAEWQRQIDNATMGVIGSGMMQNKQQAQREDFRLKGEELDVQGQKIGTALQGKLNQNRIALDRANWDLQDSNLSIRQQRVALAERKKTLEIEADKIGISRNQLEAALQAKLADIGLSRVMSVGQMMDALASADLQKQQTVRQTIQMTLQDPRYQQYLRQAVGGK